MSLPPPGADVAEPVTPAAFAPVPLPPNPDAIVSLRQVVRDYWLSRRAAVRALAGVNIDVLPGERIAVLGKSGSGKSTLMNLVGGLDRPTTGDVMVSGLALGRLWARQLADFRSATIGFVFQSFHLQARFRAWENVALPLVFAGVSRRERRRRAEGLLERVGLAGRADHRPNELSGGEQQRVALARALVNRPRLILADEPTGNLDTATSTQIMALLRKTHADGATLVIVTHDEELARTHADRVIRLADGRVVVPEGGDPLLPPQPPQPPPLPTRVGPSGPAAVAAAPGSVGIAPPPRPPSGRRQIDAEASTVIFDDPKAIEQRTRIDGADAGKGGE
jgi:putative ABC transport system ATP-binding protein